uniref:3Beta_HSD domain-containing protein n=1 Tax=Steinernema glaseri TaxID=37863 RepID=A0A1I7YSL4_9BILA
MASHTVLITGGSGFLAQHLVRYLQEHATDQIREIRCVDRKKYASLFDCPGNIPVKHFGVDIKKGHEERLDEALHGVSTVFHCAGKSFEFLHNLENDFRDDYFRDNLAATELVVEAMERQRVPNLIFVGDAYANIPTGDNYGLSEEIHSGLPKSYVLGPYGESKIRAELVGRKACEREHADGYSMNGVFLRPTIIYGEGRTNLTAAMLSLCKQYKNMPHIEGTNRGLHQFIYAGNLAGMMYQAMKKLLENPKRVNGEYMFCMDTSAAIDFKNFIRPYIEACSFRMERDCKYFHAFFISFYHELCYRIGSKQADQQLSLMGMRFLCGWSMGFSSRKLRLLLDYVPEFNQADSMKRSVEWFAKKHATPTSKDRPVTTDRNQG